MVSQLPWSRMHYWRDRRLGSCCFNISSKPKLFSSFPLPKQKVLWSLGLSSSFFINCDIPLNFAHFCTALADVGACLQKHLCQGLQREEGALRWRRGWKKSSASNLSWCCLRSHRRTGTRRAGWHSTGEKHRQTHSSTCGVYWDTGY